jgi:hypothetical protein
MKEATKELALCGMMCTLGVVILGLGGLLPLTVYVCPILASLVLLPVHEQCRRSYAWCCYAAIGLLGLILGPDKEAALLFCFLGYYPLLKPRLDTIRPGVLQWVCKLALAAVAVTAAYAILLYVLCVPQVIQELSAIGHWMLWLLVALGLVLFVIYDLVLGRLTKFYLRRKR